MAKIYSGSYDSMTWEEFEDHVILLLRSIYLPSGVEIQKTAYQNDGGKDGCASFLIGPTEKIANKDMSIVTRIWAEVKKRSSSSVDLTDIGGHLILALDERVNKIIFVTNSYFSCKTERLCESIAYRLNLSVVFINGDGLKEIEQKYLPNKKELNDAKKPKATQRQRKNDISPVHGLNLRCGFLSSPSIKLDNIDIDAQVNTGETFYWACEIKGSAPGILLKTRINPDFAHVQNAFLSDSRDLYIDHLDTRQRIVVALWCEQATKIPSSFIEFEFHGGAENFTYAVNYGSGDLVVRPTILKPSLPDSRREILEAIKQDFSLISSKGGASFFILEAIAGAGKSFLVQQLCQYFLKENTHQILLDAAECKTASSVAQSILLQAFPLPVELIPSITDDALTAWLNQANHMQDIFLNVKNLSDILDGQYKSEQSYALVELIASVLINASKVKSVVMILEDLHKSNADTIDFLQKLLGVLASRKKGKILSVFTMRPFIKASDKYSFENILQGLGSSQVRVSQYRLESPSRQEAQFLLKNSLFGLTAAESNLIIDQVGTTPFHLREALQFLRTDGTIDVSPDGFFYLLNPQGITKAVKTKELVDATKMRLRWLALELGEWFDRFILAGACLGKVFLLSDALLISSDLESQHVERIIDICFDYNILKVHRAQGSENDVKIAFDHDLVRNAVLRQAGGKRIRYAAQKLIGKLNANCVSIQYALLCYLAGNAESCMQAIVVLLNDARARKSRGEAVQYSLLRIMLLIESTGIDGKVDFLVPQIECIDEALGFIAPPKLTEPPLHAHVIDGLRDALVEMEYFGILEGEIAARLITLAKIRSEYIGDKVATAEFRYYEGRRLFGMNNYIEAYNAFCDVESIWPNGVKSRAHQLSRARLRQAICERHLGRLEDACITMKRALQLRQGADWKLLEAILANVGAFYMYSDQAKASFFWGKGLRVSRLAGHVDEAAHFLNDLAHLALMERRYLDAIHLLREAELLIDEHGLRKEQLRALLLRACISLGQNDMLSACHSLSRVEELTLAHSDFRRLWRVRANLATWAELGGNMEGAIIYDLQSLVHMPLQTEFHKSGTIGGRGSRVAGALINIVLRYNKNPKKYYLVREKLGEDIWSAAIELTSQLRLNHEASRSFAGGIGCLFQPVGSLMELRFLITE